MAFDIERGPNRVKRAVDRDRGIELIPIEKDRESYASFDLLVDGHKIFVGAQLAYTIENDKFTMITWNVDCIAVPSGYSRDDDWTIAVVREAFETYGYNGRNTGLGKFTVSISPGAVRPWPGH